MDIITGKTRLDSGWEIYDQDNGLKLQPALPGVRKFQKPTVFDNLAIALKNDKSVWTCLRARLSGEQQDRINEGLKLLLDEPAAGMTDAENDYDGGRVLHGLSAGPARPFRH